MLSLPDLSSILNGVNTDHLEDLSDKLNFYVTVYMVLFFTLITGSKQHFGQPISCMVPVEANIDAWTHYFHDYCYVGTKYLVTDQDRLSTSVSGSRAVGHAGMQYYQWVPYLLLFQVILFYLPKALWQSASHNYGNGLDMETYVKCSVKYHVEYGESRKSKVKLMALFLTDSNKFRGILGCKKDSIMYALMKWSCVLNTFGQLYFMSWFVADWNLKWAYELVGHLYHEKSSADSPYFPRVAFCDVNRLEVGQAVDYTLQCVLMFNFVNEKIFLFMFCWVMGLLAVNTITAIRQTLQLVCRPFRFWTAQLILPPTSVLFRDMSWSPLQSNTLLTYFVHNSLGCDGIFLLESVSSHSGRMMAREIAAELFNILFRNEHQSVSNSHSEPPLPRPKILGLSEEEAPLGSNDFEDRPLISTSLDKRFSKSSPTISAPPYHLLFTESGRERKPECPHESNA